MAHKHLREVSSDASSSHRATAQTHEALKQSGAGGNALRGRTLSGNTLSNPSTQSSIFRRIPSFYCVVAALACALVLGAGLHYAFTQHFFDADQHMHTRTDSKAADTQSNSTSTDSATQEEQSVDAAPDDAREPAQKQRRSQELTELNDKLMTRLEPYGSAVAVSVVDVQSGDFCNIHADKRFVSASMIKLAILARYVQALDEASIDPSERVSLKSMHIVGGTGKIQSERKSSYSYDELCRYMIMYSDNTATNVLIDKLGLAAINDQAKKLGCENTELNRKMMQLNTGVENWTSAEDVARLLNAFAHKSAGSAEACDIALDYLSKQTDDEGIAQGIPKRTFAHKTGSLNTIRHDGGIVMGAHPYVLVVLSDIGAGKANTLMAQLAQDVDSYMSAR